MPSLMAWQHGPVPPDETEVRSTITVVDDNAPAAEAPTAPSYNSLVTDPDTEGGLTTRQVSTYKVAGVQSVPANIENATNTGINDINARISTAGTAAEREAQGVRGHGTYDFAQSIEVPFPDGHAFGSDYFSVERNRTVSDQMTPTSSPDPATTSAAQATATANARDAVAQSQTGSPYQAMVDTFMGRRQYA